MNEIDTSLTKESDSIVSYLKSLKNDLDLYDKNHKTAEQIAHINQMIPEFRSKMDEHFSKTSSLFDSYDEESYKVNQEYYIKRLWDYLYSTKINKHIYDKPFGYPGDFIIMNYIQDYQDQFLGDSSYEKIVNYYSLKLPFCLSNLARREYIRSKIINISAARPGLSITSVACGSIRELLDLRDSSLAIQEINCIDFEPKVFDYINEQLKASPFPDRTKVSLLQKDVMEMIKLNSSQSPVKNQDFIYFSGLFDYFPDRIARKVIARFFALLKDGGFMLICNCSKKNKKLHSYYEVLGKWEMIYRNEDDMVNLISDISPKRHFFEYPKNGECYNFLLLEK